MKKWICTVCGYVHEGEQPPEKCPQCGVPADKFKEQVEGEKRMGSRTRSRCCQRVSAKIS